MDHFSMSHGCDRQVSHVTVSSQGKAVKPRRSVIDNVADWFGVNEEGDRTSLQWENRRRRYADSIGKLKDQAMPPARVVNDDLDGNKVVIRDPLRMPSGRSVLSGDHVGKSAPCRKSSVARMSVKAIGNVMGARSKIRRLTHLRGSLMVTDDGATSVHGEDFNLVDDVFYDDSAIGESMAGVQPIKNGAYKPLHSVPPGAGRRLPPLASSAMAGRVMVDSVDFGMSRIQKKVLDSASRGDKRMMGAGLVGRLLRPSIRSLAFTKDVNRQIDEMDDHRPYFTYWVTFVQIVVFLVAATVYGVAPFGVGKHTETKMVRLSHLARAAMSYTEAKNIWFGPRQADLIHLGAKYSPCMRVDLNLQQSLQLERQEENQSACCVRNDGSGCVQRVRSHCGFLSTWKKWSVGNKGPGGRTSGTVCGQDPSYCLEPASAAPFEWSDAITDWPVCTATRRTNASLGSKSDRHMACEILGRPCCHGIQGECMITTREYCDLKRGRFHEDKFLCSQTHCFEKICGMIPFANDDSPDQFYRLWTSLFLHGGLFHLLVTVAFQMFLMRDMEKLVGAIRMAIIYMGSGIAGNLASCTFLPYQVDSGPSGSQFGVLACLLVEMLQSYQMYRRPHVAILKLVGPVVVLFLLGVLPWFDNWSHLFGFFFGFLIAFAVMPYVTFGKFDRRRKFLTIVVCLGSALTLFIILFVVFYVAPLSHCESCEYFNCIPFVEGLCENMSVNLKKNSTYSLYI